VYGALSGIYAVSEGDAARFRQTCPEHPDVRVLGDTRFDSVLDRRGRMTPPPVPSAFRSEDPVLIVGSSWPADEERLFPELRDVLAANPALRVMLVPHGVHEAHLAAIEAAFPGEPMVRFTALGADGEPAGGGQPRLLLVDAVGQLAALYGYADLAYVGGAFSTGVHNVMEPAALGLPAVFGPHYGNSPEAEALVTAGHAFPAGSADEIRQALSCLLDDPQARRSAGEAARAYVEGSAGAAQRCFDIIQGSLA
jgi:3-deoxy-D-manno-octulosonic-acid transferase